MRHRHPVTACATLGVLFPAVSALAQTAPPNPPGARESWTIVEEVIVTGQRGPDYAAAVATTATRTPTPLEQVPQSIQVINRALIEDQDRRTVADVLANVAGAVAARPEEVVLVQPLVRGFPAEVYIDGVPAYTSTAASDPATLINVERVEVVKGPTGALYGGGLGAPLGGLINLTSKSPSADTDGTVGVRLGSFDTASVFVDANVSRGIVGLRLTAEAEQADSAIDAISSERLSINPTLRLALSDNTSLTVRGRYDRVEQLEYTGLPAAVTLAPDVKVDRFQYSGATDGPPTTVQNRSVTGTLAHRFSDAVEGTLTLRSYRSEFDEYSSFVFPSFFRPTSPTRYPLVKGYLPTDVEEATADANLIVRGRFGGVGHTLLLGTTFDRTKSDAAIGIDFRPIGFIDYADGGSAASFGAIPALTRRQEDRLRTSAVYVQDQVDVGRLHLTGGLRQTRLEVEQRTTGTGQVYDRTTPRLGVTYDVGPGVSLYTGYAEGFRGVLNFLGSEPPKLETSRAYEGGLKLARSTAGLSGTLAVFELTRENVVIDDVTRPGAQLQTGEQRSRGLEIDVVWEPTPSLSALLTYARTEAEVTRDSRIPVGDALRRVPDHAGRAAARYRFLAGPLEGLEVGGGVSAGSERELTLPNTVAAESYAIADAQAAYTFGPVTLALSITNLTDADYFEPYQFLGQAVVIPAQPRSAFLTLQTRF